MMELKNNKILITGGTSGIGLALGRKLLQGRNTVILLGRNEKKLRKLKQAGFKTIKCDLSSKADIERAVLIIQNEYSTLNMLFNNAGMQYNYQFTDTIIPLNKIDQEITTNVIGQIILTHLLIPVLSANQKAFIINTTSALGAYPKSDGIVYSASKAAMRNFTVGIRNKLKSLGIKVMEFIPPVTETGMTISREGEKMKVDRLIEKIIPQLLKEKQVLTVKSVRFFLLISTLLPGLAKKILDK